MKILFSIKLNCFYAAVLITKGKTGTVHILRSQMGFQIVQQFFYGGKNRESYWCKLTPSARRTITWKSAWFVLVLQVNGGHSVFARQ